MYMSHGTATARATALMLLCARLFAAATPCSCVPVYNHCLDHCVPSLSMSTVNISVSTVCMSVGQLLWQLRLLYPDRESLQTRLCRHSQTCAVVCMLRHLHSGGVMRCRLGGRYTTSNSTSGTKGWLERSGLWLPQVPKHKMKKTRKLTQWNR